MDKKNIVILGAGFGGLTAAMDLAKGITKLGLLHKYDVTIVDKNDCHLFTPLLYKLAAGGEKPGTQCTYDTSSLIGELPIKFLQSEIESIDLIGGDVHTKRGDSIKSDFLIIALGSETNFFGIPGLQEHALQLKTVDSALQIRSALMKLFSETGKKKVVIGGAGANGIELASQIRLWANIAEEQNPSMNVEVELVEAMPTILPGLNPNVQKIAAKRLQKLDVHVTMNAKITSVSEKEISLDGASPISFDLFVWTGGVKTPNLITQLPLQRETHGKPMAHSDMICLPATPDLKLYAMVYGIGDSVCFMNPKTNRPVPAVARAAIIQAEIAAKNILEEIKALETPSYKPRLEKYIPVEYPYIIPVGEHWAVGKFGPFILEGAAGWLFSKAVEINYLRSIMPFGAALAAWRKMA